MKWIGERFDSGKLKSRLSLLESLWLECTIMCFIIVCIMMCIDMCIMMCIDMCIKMDRLSVELKWCLRDCLSAWINSWSYEDIEVWLKHMNYGAWWMRWMRKCKSHLVLYVVLEQGIQRKQSVLDKQQDQNVLEGEISMCPNEQNSARTSNLWAAVGEGSTSTRFPRTSYVDSKRRILFLIVSYACLYFNPLKYCQFIETVICLSRYFIPLIFVIL